MVGLRLCVAAPPGALEHQVRQLRRGRQPARRARRGGGFPAGQRRHLSATVCALFKNLIIVSLFIFLFSFPI